MPARDQEIFVIPITSPQNETNKKEKHLLDSSNNANIRPPLASLKDHSLTPFPSLTGLRSQPEDTDLKSASIDSRLEFLHLQDVTASLGASPVAALQAAWAVILSTYTAAQDDVTFSTLISSSTSHKSDSLSKDAFHAIPTRIHLQNWDQATNSAILTSLTEANELALPQSKPPVVSSAEQEEPSKHGTIVALRNKTCPDSHDAVLLLNDALNKDERLAVSVVVWPDLDGHLKLTVVYSDLFLNEPTALVMLEQLEDILAFILAFPVKPIADSLNSIRTSLLSKSNEALEESTNLSSQPPCLHAQFEDFAIKSPLRVALDFRKDLCTRGSSQDITWTYEQLNSKADNFATYLIQHFGRVSGEVIPICMEKRPELYVAILGILKTGAAWCPIDLSFPVRRRYDLVVRTGARILVVAARKSTDSPEDIPRGVTPVDITCLLDAADGQFERPRVEIDSLAYLIWTSGTTGDPKGVPIHHKAASTSMRALQRSIPTDVAGGIVRCLQFSHFTFDVFVQDLFYTWGVGGTVISSPREIMLGSFAELATVTKATHAHLTPAFAASVPRERCPTLEIITMIGERLPQAVADDWSQNMRAFNTYGPAETAVVSTFRRFGAAGDKIRSDNIGSPLDSVSTFVMCNDRSVMKHGIGELALGGPQLSKGYWNDPEKSLGIFVWNEQYSKHLYMTGDMARQLHDGSLDFVGRRDDLIKIQGIRVELSEISFSLRSCHPLVEQVEIQYIDRQDRPSKVIVAFLAIPTLGKGKGSKSHFIGDEESIPIVKSALLEAQKNLPDYMIPSVFLVVNSIPRTSSAKTDKSILKNIYGSVDLGMWERALALNDNSSKDVAVWNTRESVLIGIIADISGTSRESMTRASDLRSIGIDSIAATKLAPTLKSVGSFISVADILQCQSLGDILQLTAKSSTSQPTKRGGIEAFHSEWYARVKNVIKRDDVFVAPALPLQESLLSESMQNASAYWSHTFLSLDSQVDITRLYEAWLQVVGDTEALRTGFIPSAAVLEHHDDAPSSNSTFMQLVYGKATFDWKCVETPEGNMKDVASQQALEVAESRQKGHFRDPLLAVRMFRYSRPRVMMISVHHSIRDEVSLDYMLEDVIKKYQAVRGDSNQRHQLREALQLMLPTEIQIRQDEEYWSKTLDGFNATDDANTWPDLTGKNASIEDSAVEFLTHTQALSTNYKDLQGVALSLGASSVASLLRVAWGTLLLDYLETDSVVFAETWSNRVDDFALADVVGPLIVVLPVPFRAVGSAREALLTDSNFQRESRDHRSVHPRVIKRLLKRSEGQTLYPATFNFLPGLREDDQNGCSTMWNKMDDIVGLTVEHPVALNVAQIADGSLEMEILASQKITSKAHLAVLASQVDKLVEIMIRHPDVPLTQLLSYFPRHLLSKTSVAFSEEVQLAYKQNPTNWVDHYAGLHPQWLAAQVVTSLGNEECDSESWSFAELRAAYDRVAAFISHSGHHNRMIAVCLDRRIEAYAIVLGILASGNIYLPIDEDLPGERKSFILQDSTSIMLFTTQALAVTFSSTPSNIRVVYVDDSTYAEQMVNGSSAETLSQSRPSDNAYLLYTSGSTGVPKGVLVGRGNLCSFVEGLSEFIYPLIPGMEKLSGKGRYLGLASRAFDVHIAEMFLAWRRGLAAVTGPRTLLLDNLELALRKLKITHASFVPSLIDQAGLNPEDLPDLRYLGVGGENMSKRVVETWASNDNAALINAYGPTEMSIGCTAAEVTRGSSLRNVGQPYGNSVAHVLVPGSNRYTFRGVAGELCFTGALVANGYHNRPDAKGFVDDFNGQRMYRTGDIVRMMADDTLEYLRREDDQTKIRGQRLELGEITEAIRSTAMKTLCLTKLDVATMVAQHPNFSRAQLVSFVAPVQNSEKSLELPEVVKSAHGDDFAGKVQDICRKVLPSYMVPDVVIPLTKLPLAPASGKADFKRLKSLFADMPVARTMNQTLSEQSPQPNSGRRNFTQAEKTIQSAIMTTLAVDADNISATTNIFRLGLDSLSAISLAIKLQGLGYDCTVSSVLRNPSIELLALLPQTVEGKRTTSDEVARVRSNLADLQSRFRALQFHGLIDSSIQAVKPCLALQETLVATSFNNKSDALYVNHLTLNLAADVDFTRLRRAWSTVVADHEILRTCFQGFENSIVQIVLEYDESRSASWETVETSDPETASQLQRSAYATAIISDIARKAPLRLTLFQPPSNDENPILLISIHHAIYDAESIAMILEEFNLQYHSVTPPAHASFDTMIEHVYSQDQQAAKFYWKDYLMNYRPTSILGRADVSDEEQNLAFFPTVDRILTTPLTKLEEFSSSISGTLTSTIQAGFGIALAQMLEISDVVFGVVLSGRTVSIEKPHTIVAPCITTIPQRVKICTENSTIIDTVKEAQSGFVASLEFQHTALRNIHRWVEAEKPLFDCLISYLQKTESKPGPYPDLWTASESSMPNEFPLSIEFEADHAAGRIRAHCVLSPALGGVDKAASLLENIDLLLGALVRQEHVTSDDLGISKSDSAVSNSKPQVWNEAHWSPVELKLRELAAEICDTSSKEILKGTSFFSLGIDSIIAIRFAQRLRRTGMECSSTDVMRYSCVGMLAQKIDSLSPQTGNVESLAEKTPKENLEQTIPEIPTLSAEDIVTDLYVCTPLQSSMLTQTLGSDGRLYVHHHGIRLAQHIDLLRLKQAWESITLKTEILRTTFHFSNALNSWMAAVHQENLHSWCEYDIDTSLSDSLADISEKFLYNEEADFEQPPWRITVLKTAAETLLVVSMHHSLYDGESISLLFQDLARLYDDAELPPRAPFSDAARAISKSNTDAEEYWLQKINGFEGSETSLSQEATKMDVLEIQNALEISAGSIVKACKDLGVTVQTVALLSYGKTLACISGHRDVVFGNIVGGRSLAMPGADEVIGPLFNTVPSRIVFDKTYITNRTAAVEIQKSSGDSQPHQHASLGKIQYAWRQKVGHENAHLFDTLFVFQSTVNKPSSTDRLWTALNMDGVAVPTEYSTNFEFEQRQDETVIRVVSRKGQKTREQLQEWLTNFEQIFLDILKHPQRSILAFPSSFQSLPLAISSSKSCPAPRDEIKPGPDLDSIRAALSEVSGIPIKNISFNASIFSLGLDSISAIRVATTCRKQGYGVSVADVLQGRTLKGICRQLRERNPEQSNHVTDESMLISAESRSKALVFTNIKDENVEDVLPCLAGQIFQLASWLKSRRTMCEATWTYQCSKRLNVDDLRSSWRELRKRHPILRTTFVTLSPEDVVQVVLKPSALSHNSFKYVETPSGTKNEIIDQIELESKQPFDLFSPPTQLRLIRGETQDIIVLRLHHATYDAWTISTIIEDLAALYDNINLPPPILYDSFISHTVRSLRTSPEEAYWRKSLQSCQMTLLQPSTTKASNPNPGPTILILKSAIPHLQNLESLCRHTSTTLPTLILLAYARTLARHTSTANPTFGLYQTGRSASFPNISPLCFPCLNILPVQIYRALERPTVESARALQADLAERVKYEQSFLREVLKWVAGCEDVNGGENGGKQPLFNTYVNILSYEGARRDSPSSAPSPSPSPLTAATTTASTPPFTQYQNSDLTTGTGTSQGKEDDEKEDENGSTTTTAIDALDTSYLAQHNFYLDIVRRVEDDCVDFGVRCDAPLMDDGAVRAFARDVVEEMERIGEEIAWEGDGRGV